MTNAGHAHPAREAFPAELARREYDIEAIAARRITDGDEADIWKVQSASGVSWCLKTFRRLAPHAVHQRAGLMDRLSREGFPVPHVRRTVRGELATAFDGAGTMVCEWLEGTNADALSPQAGDAAGTMLGRLHLALRRGMDVVPQTSRKNWEVDPPELALSKCRTIQARVEALPAPTALDRRIHHAIGQRIAMLRGAGVEKIREGLPSLARQLIHGDYTRPNLLFAEGRLAGILDPLGITGYPVWELGRIAFEPLTVVSRADWRDVASAIVRGYRGEAALTRLEATAVVRVTLLYYLFSFWGVEGRYAESGGVAPTGHEDYWINRQAVAQVLFENLADLEALCGS